MNEEKDELAKLLDQDFDEYTEEMVDYDLNIDSSSVYAWEETLKESPKRQAKYHRAYAKAVKEMETLSLALEVLVSEIMKELEEKAESEGKPIPATAKSEVRRIKVPLDPRYRKVKRKLIKANETMNLLKGTCFAFNDKSRRITELGRIVEKYLVEDPVVYKRNKDKDAKKAAANLEYD